MSEKYDEKELDEVREFFASDRYAMETTGIVIDEAGADYSKVSVRINESHLSATGHVMGGVMFVLADFAFAVATNTRGACALIPQARSSIFIHPRTALFTRQRAA